MKKKKTRAKKKVSAKAKSKAKSSKPKKSTKSKPARKKVTLKSSAMQKIDELNNEARRSINAAKTAHNFAKAAKDTGTKSLYLSAATHHRRLAREAQKKALQIMKNIKP